jgi:cytoskeletal protein RodZ
MDDRPTDIGSRLRQAREQRGLSLHDIANSTKISMAVLKAIEANDFSRLPGGLFARSYVRAFAERVGLNPDELAAEYRERFEPQPPAPTFAPDIQARGDRMETLRRVAVVVIGVGALVAMALYSRRVHVPAEYPRREPPAATMTDREAAPTSDQPTSADRLVKTSAHAAAASLRLEMQFTAPCWVSARADGDVVVYRLMQTDERTVVEARHAIALRIGDADAVVYTINGSPGRPLGRSGQVVTLDITTDNYERLLDELAGGLRLVPPAAGAVTSDL